MVGRLLSFWDGIFSGAMLNFQGVDHLSSQFSFCLQMSQLKSAMIHDEFHLRTAWWMLRIFRAAAAINQDCRCSSAWLSQRDIGDNFQAPKKLPGKIQSKFPQKILSERTKTIL